MVSSTSIDFSKLVSIIDSKEYINLRQKYECYTSEAQINFLCNLIQNYKLPNQESIKNVAEIGTRHGFTTYFMLKEGVKKYGKDFKLTSFDLEIGKTGQIVEENSTDKEKESVAIHKGISFSDYCTQGNNEFEKNKIDMVFVDGQHTHPAPLIDVLFLLPFMKKDGLIVFHDINYYHAPNDWGASYVYNGLDVEKVSPENDTIGYIVVPDDITSLYENLIHIAKQSFSACIWEPNKYKSLTEREIPLIEEFMPKYYDKDFAEKITTIIKNNVAKYNEFNLEIAENTKSLQFMYFKILELEDRINCLQDELKCSKYNLLQAKYKNNKVLLYGAGINANKILNEFDFSKLDIVGISDLKFETNNIGEFLGFKTIPPSCIKNTDYDIILLTVKEKGIARNYLTNTLKINKEKIIDF